MYGVLKVVYHENMGNGKATNVGTRLKTVGDRGFYCQFIMLTVILKTNTFRFSIVHEQMLRYNKRKTTTIGSQRQ
jgi:hypothetical protein